MTAPQCKKAFVADAATFRSTNLHHVTLLAPNLKINVQTQSTAALPTVVPDRTCPDTAAFVRAFFRLRWPARRAKLETMATPATPSHRWSCNISGH